jgi:hypothetical protein
MAWRASLWVSFCVRGTFEPARLRDDGARLSFGVVGSDAGNGDCCDMYLIRECSEHQSSMEEQHLCNLPNNPGPHHVPSIGGLNVEEAIILHLDDAHGKTDVQFHQCPYDAS